MGNPRSIPEVLGILARSELGQGLDRAALSALTAELEPVWLEGGDVLCRQGEPGDCLYVLVAGRLTVSVRAEDGSECALDEVTPGGTVGEVALLTGQPRMATVAAAEGSELVRLSREAFERLAERQPALVEHLARAILPRLRRSYLADVLPALFGELDPKATVALAAQVEWRQLGSGETLFHEGEPGDALYAVVQGRLRVVQVDERGGERVLRELGPGEMVGELALLTDEVRSATVYAVRDTTVVALARTAFERLVEGHPRVMLSVSRAIASRSRGPLRSDPGRAMTATCVALLPLSEEVAATDCAGRLATALASHGPTLLLDAERCDALFGRPGAAQWGQGHPLAISLGALLGEQERSHRFVVFAADGSWSGWTRRCVEHADVVLLVASAGADPRPGSQEAELRALGTRVRVELLLLHPDATAQPSGTLQWLEPRSLAAHYHVRRGSTEDYGHVARRLEGSALGLVLGGGGARGYAHVGVYRALLEAGRPVDVVGGTSMGALVGGCIAMGMPPEEMLARSGKLTTPSQLFDLTLPAVSFFASGRVTRLLQHLFGDLCIEDLWRPFFCVSSNLAHAVPTVHTRGPLWRAVRASLAIPAVFSPLLLDGDLHVDGAVLNNLPVDVMRDVVGDGRVVAVNVFPAEDLHKPYRLGPSQSGWQAVLSAVNPFARAEEAVPWIFETLLRVMALGDVQAAKQKRALCDLYLEPQVAHFGALDFRKYAEIAEVGYQAAREALADWGSSIASR